MFFEVKLLDIIFFSSFDFKISFVNIVDSLVFVWLKKFQKLF
jgi:hypothetical protein